MLQLINKFSKFSDCKFIIHFHATGSVAFLYTSNRLREKINNPLVIASKTIRYLGINLTKQRKDLHTENCNILMKEIEEETSKWKDIHVHGLEGFVLLKFPYSPRSFIDSVQFLSRSQRHFL